MMKHAYPINTVIGIRGFRSTVCETVHHASALVSDQTGKCLKEFPGSSNAIVITRSMIKPLQAIGLLSHARVSELRPEQWAIISASHGATMAHVALVEELLASAGLDESALQCGPDYPLDTAYRHQLIREQASKRPIFHNCSGKHAGMLLACVWNDWPTDTYLDPTHPLQQLITQQLITSSGSAGIEVLCDGCGAPTFGLPMPAAGQLFAQFTSDPIWQPIVEGMLAYPELVGDADRIDTCLMKTSDGQLLAKVGADGGIAVANRALKQSLILKVWDGRLDIRNMYVIALLADLGWLSLTQAELLWQHKAFNPKRLNSQGKVVGEFQFEIAWEDPVSSLSKGQLVQTLHTLQEQLDPTTLQNQL